MDTTLGDVTLSIKENALSSDVKAAISNVCEKAERAGTFSALVECYRVITEETRENAIDYIASRIREESK